MRILTLSANVGEEETGVFLPIAGGAAVDVPGLPEDAVEPGTAETSAPWMLLPEPVPDCL